MKRFAAALTALVLSSSCANEEIVVATVDKRPPEDAHFGPRGCGNDAECRPDEFCSKPTCEDMRGTCAHRPLICGDNPDPFCGCDGINYFNDCLRRRNGVSAATPGECSDTAVGCGGASHLGCPGQSRCVTLLRLGPAPTCPADPTGACWVLPDDCSSTTSDESWMPCGPPAPCVDTCTAMRSGVPHWLSPDCP